VKILENLFNPVDIFNHHGKRGNDLKMTTIITIDGPSGAGKSTVAKLVAEKTGLRYLDSGSIYRALAYVLNNAGIIPVESEELGTFLKSLDIQLNDTSIKANDEDVTGKIRTPGISSLASSYSALPMVREKLLDLQRCQATGNGLVAEGRDMGTVVFPYADLKFFLIAQDDQRVLRRWKELKNKGYEYTQEEIRSQITERDRNDTNRKVSPLVKADDAIEIDTTELSIDDVVHAILNLFHNKSEWPEGPQTGGEKK